MPSRKKRKKHRSQRLPIVAPVCPYCGKTANLVDSAVIYHGRSYGPAWVCGDYPACDAYCGCHPGTNRPLGTLANKELRKARNDAHDHVDAFWKKDVLDRSDTYHLVARLMGIDISQCHIAMFTVDQCRLAVAVCKVELEHYGIAPMSRMRQ
jgi:Protein of unknown function (DUF3268).